MKIDRTYRTSYIPKNAHRVFEGVIFDVYQWQQELYDGTTETFELLARNDTVVVYPVLPDGSIYLIQDTQPHRDTITTAPAGRVEEGEDIEAAARRELLEETGLAAQTLELLFSFRPESKIDWEVYVYVARGCAKVSDTHLDPGEKIEPNVVTFEEMLTLLSTGKMKERKFDVIVHEALRDPKKMSELKTLFRPA